MLGLKRLVWWTMIGMFVVVVAGDLVTNTQSGHGCGNSWPLCNGAVVPTFNWHTTIEYSHRAVSGLEGLAVVLSAWLVWRRLPRPDVRVLAVAALVFLFAQVFLGAGAVVFNEPPLLLAAHMGVSFSAFGSLLLLYRIVARAAHGQGAPPDVPRATRLWVWGGLAAVYALIFTGGYVRHTASGLGCGTEWPLCEGSLWGSLTGPAAQQMVHRGLAAGVGLFVLAMALHLARSQKGRPDLVRLGWTAVGLVLGQALVGGITVLSNLGLAEISLHSATAALFFSALLVLSYEVAPLGWRQARPDPVATAVR
ncbi:MAG TPA: COX15/CtaA family protein [Limnochordia bacterium]|nr:COX15/CtaA family protein [Limnochordia bacterium]